MNEEKYKATLKKTYDELDSEVKKHHRRISVELITTYFEYVVSRVDDSGGKDRVFILFFNTCKEVIRFIRKEKNPESGEYDTPTYLQYITKEKAMLTFKDTNYVEMMRNLDEKNSIVLMICLKKPDSELEVRGVSRIETLSAIVLTHERFKKE